MQSQAIKTAQSKGRKVYIGLSGGVDSSVSAALLKEAGYDVTGVFIKVWQPDWIQCTWKEDRRDAMRVCAKLDIPFITLDLEKEYKKYVIDYMISEYSIGRTPNPDVMCNKSVKFGAFYDWAIEHGADFVATGHYAKVDGDFKLNAGDDANKDQSYFLWNITTEQLPHILFPIGNIEKSEVRELARKFDLPTAEKRDSQGLCFIGKIDVKEFLSRYIEQVPGKVLNEKGEVIGNHKGALLFTIGERHGFIIEKKTPNDERYFVSSKDIKTNTLVVTADSARRDLPEQKSATISDVNWIKYSPENLSDKSHLKARIRYRQPLQSITIKKYDERSATIQFLESQPTLTSGQSLVIYKEGECLGGGIID